MPCVRIFPMRVVMYWVMRPQAPSLTRIYSFPSTCSPSQWVKKRKVMVAMILFIIYATPPPDLYQLKPRDIIAPSVMWYLRLCKEWSTTASYSSNASFLVVGHAQNLLFHTSSNGAGHTQPCNSVTRTHSELGYWPTVITIVSQFDKSSYKEWMLRKSGLNPLSLVHRSSQSA